jgi:hypothetical protein
MPAGADRRHRPAQSGLGPDDAPTGTGENQRGRHSWPAPAADHRPAHAGQPIHLDPEGIERITTFAKQYQGLLVVVDAMASCMRPLGIAEESADFAGPIGDLMEAVEPHGATVVAIHHSNNAVGLNLGVLPPV